MNDILRAMRERALVDPSFRQTILATRNAADPLTALCGLAQANGFNLTLADIISDGEEFSCNQTKSTNGGNPMPYDCFDDSYDCGRIMGYEHGATNRRPSPCILVFDYSNYCH